MDDCDGGLPEEPIDTGRHRLRLLAGMDPTLRTLYEAVDAARERVLIETYIYRDDHLGRDFGERLAAAAARGVRTRLLYDPLGSQKVDGKFFEELSKRGVDTRPYRATPYASLRPFPRDHGRVLVVDGSAWTGGLAFGDEWLPKRLGGEGWWDVCVQVVSGPVVEDFAELFEIRWREAIDEQSPCDYQTRNKHPDVELVSDCPDETTIVYQRHRERIRSARRRVFIENSYFFPPPDLLQDLVDAVKRGVDVRVIVPKNSDLPIVERAARAEYRTWLRHGLRVFEYERCMMHSKFAVVDDDWCTIGTFNMNPTSLGLTNEVNLIVHDARFVARAAAQFEEDLQASCEVTEEQLKRRPLLQEVVDRLAADALNLGDLAFGPPRD